MRHSKWFALLRIISFLGFFFAVFAIIVQTRNSYRVFKHRNEYVNGYFIFKEYKHGQFRVGVHHSSGYISYKGVVHDSIEASITKSNAIKYLEEEFDENKIDSISAWTLPFRGMNALPKKKGETEFNMYKYMYPYFRLLISIGISFHLFIVVLNRRLKRKEKQ
ncbi:MAG: hypothetical protein R6U95_01290 [Bacteroidales bacterium]